MIGQTISHYRILEKLGEGGMGVVYKAEDTKLHRPVALKFVPPELTRDPEAKERFTHEAQAASALDHPNIAVIHEIDETKDGSSFICMAYYEGQTLKEKIKAGPLKIEEAIDTARQIAEGLQRAHEAGIVHRDLKPANVIITKRGEVKIVDFGLAKLIGDTKITKTGRTVGTAAYMSPEQARGYPVDHRTDIWSFGVVLYEMLTGQLPFKGDYEQAVIYGILNENPPEISDFRADLPENLQRVCGRCLQKQRTARPKTMKEVLELLSERRVIARLSSQIWRRRLNRRHPAVIVPMLALLALSAWFLVSQVLGPRAPVPTKWRVGILPFQNVTNEVEIAEWPLLVQMLFVGEFTGIEELGIVDPLSLNGLIESSFGTPEPQRGPELYELIKSAGVSFIIDGSIFKSAHGYKIQSNIVDPASEEVSYSADVLITSDEDLPQAVDILSQEFLDFFQVEIFRSSEDKNLRPWLSHRTVNIGARKAFMQASQLIYRSQPGGEKYLLRAIELDSTFISPRVWLISGLVYQARIKEAKEQYQYLLELQSDTSPFENAMIGWAGAYLGEDVSAQARYLRVALDYSPGNNILLYNLGRIRYIMEDYEGAAQALTPAVEMQWQYSPAYYLLAECYNLIGRYKEAKRILERSLSIKPVYPDVYSLLFTLSLRDNDTTKARAYETIFIQRSREAGNPLGTVYGALGTRNLSDRFHHYAIKFYRRALFLQPDHPGHHDGLAEALYREGDVDAARIEFYRCLQLDSGWIRAHLMLGEIYEKTGETESALKHYNAYLARDSTSTDAKAIRQRIEALKH